MPASFNSLGAVVLGLCITALPLPSFAADFSGQDLSFVDFVTK